MALVSEDSQFDDRRLLSFGPARIVLGTVALGAVALLPTWLALEGLWRAMKDYSHGYLVVAAVAVWLWTCRARLDSYALQPSAIGVALLFSALLVWLVAFSANNELGQQLLLPVILWLIVYAAAGAAAGRIVLVPLAFLYFAIPIWEILIPSLRRLTVFATESGMGFAGVPTVVEGSQVSIPEGTFVVSEGCSGRNYLIATLTVASLAAAMAGLRATRAVLLIGSAAFLALFANWVRVLIVVTAGHLTHMQHYFIKVSHIGLGNVIFVVLLACVLGLAWRLAPSTARPATKGLGDSARGAVGQRHTILMARLWGAAAAAVVLAVTLGFAGWSATRDAATPRLAPLPVAAGTWRGPLPPAAEWAPHFEGSAAERRAAYASDAGTVEIYLNVYGRQRQGVELIFYRNSLLRPGEWGGAHWAGLISSVSAALGRRPAVIEVADGDANSWVIAYSYVVGGQLTANDAVAQLLYGVGAMVGTPPAGIVATAARCAGHSCAAARASLESFWKQMNASLLPIVRYSCPQGDCKT
jgi:EpsI family protein